MSLVSLVFFAAALIFYVIITVATKNGKNPSSPFAWYATMPFTASVLALIYFSRRNGNPILLLIIIASSAIAAELFLRSQEKTTVPFLSLWSVFLLVALGLALFDFSRPTRNLRRESDSESFLVEDLRAAFADIENPENLDGFSKVQELKEQVRRATGGRWQLMRSKFSDVDIPREHLIASYPYGDRFTQFYVERAA